MQGASQVTLESSLSRVDFQVLRGVRLHATRFLKGLEADADLRRSQLGLAHSYSRAKVRLDALDCVTLLHAQTFEYAAVLAEDGVMHIG